MIQDRDELCSEIRILDMKIRLAYITTIKEMSQTIESMERERNHITKNWLTLINALIEIRSWMIQTDHESDHDDGKCGCASHVASRALNKVGHGAANGTA